MTVKRTTYIWSLQIIWTVSLYSPVPASSKTAEVAETIYKPPKQHKLLWTACATWFNCVLAKSIHSGQIINDAEHVFLWTLQNQRSFYCIRMAIKKTTTKRHRNVIVLHNDLWRLDWPHINWWNLDKTWRHDATNKCVLAFFCVPVVGFIITGQNKKTFWPAQTEIVFMESSMGNMWADA